MAGYYLVGEASEYQETLEKFFYQAQALLQSTQMSSPQNRLFQLANLAHQKDT